MGARNHFHLFLVSVFIFSVAGLGQHDDKKQLATIHVIDAMPKDSQPIQIQCDSIHGDLGNHELHLGEDYQFGVEEKALYYCGAIAGRQVASWHAFQPDRDGNQKAVFWLLKAEGIFFSWDNSTWVRDSGWFTE